MIRVHPFKAESQQITLDYFEPGHNSFGLWATRLNAPKTQNIWVSIQELIMNHVKKKLRGLV